MEMVQHVLTRSDTNQIKKTKEKHSSNECHTQAAPAFVWINCMDIAYGMEEAVDLRNETTLRLLYYIHFAAHATKY